LILTGVAINFDWEDPKVEKSCDVSLVTFFVVITMTSLKWLVTDFLKVQFRHNPFENKTQFGQITQIQVIKIGD